MTTSPAIWGSPCTAALSRVPEGRHGGRRHEGHQHEERDLAAVILKAQKGRQSERVFKHHNVLKVPHLTSYFQSGSAGTTQVILAMRNAGTYTSGKPHV